MEGAWWGVRRVNGGYMEGEFVISCILHHASCIMHHMSYNPIRLKLAMKDKRGIKLPSRQWRSLSPAPKSSDLTMEVLHSPTFIFTSSFTPDHPQVFSSFVKIAKISLMTKAKGLPL